MLQHRSRRLHHLCLPSQQSRYPCLYRHYRRRQHRQSRETRQMRRRHHRRQPW
jgi:hypothetical protein